MSGFVYAIIVSRSKEDMEVLSNKEICILLKILSNEELMKGSTSIFKLDSSFTKEEVEHLQKEINLSEDYTKNDVMQIKDSGTRCRGKKLNNGFNIRIYKTDAILSYATKYVDGLMQNSLVGTVSGIKLPKLFKEFYSLIKDKTDFKDLVSKNLQYMPVILFAYINKLIDLKFPQNKDDDTLFCTVGTHTFRCSIESNGTITEVRGTFYISDTSPLKDAIMTIEIDGEPGQFETDFLKSLIVKQRTEKLSIPSENFDEKALTNKLQNDFGLTELAINVLCACKYLMDNDITAVTNIKISEYLTQNKFPVSSEGIKQCTRTIKDKCNLSDTRGVPSLVQALQLKGYTIPPLKPLAKG